MYRRVFLKQMVYVGAGLSLSCRFGHMQAGTFKRPNVLILIADDMNDYGFYDTYPGVKMP